MSRDLANLADMHDSPGTFADGITFAARIVEEAREAFEDGAA